MIAVLDAIAVGPVGMVGHDVDGAVMQSMADAAPDRFTGLFFFDFVFPGVGARMGASDRPNEIWYHSFHQMGMAPALLSSSREACEFYISHMVHHWCDRKSSISDVIKITVDNFLKLGNLEGGLAYFPSAHARRIAMM